MSPSILALLAFLALTLTLPFVIVNYRTLLVLRGKKAANDWPRGGESKDPALVRRMSDAHLNCLENLPVYAGIVLAASLMDALPVVDTLAIWLILARLGQTTTHVISTSAPAVTVRALFYAIQLVLMAVMIVQLAC